MTRARTLADMISDGVIGTTELADDAITPVKLDETGNYTIAQLDVNGTLTSDGLTVNAGTSALQTNITGAGGLFRLQNYSGNGATINSDLYTIALTYDNSSYNGALHFQRGSGAADGHFYISTNNQTKRLEIDNYGDITFYDTSGNASFVYDESAGSTFNENGDNKDFRVESSTSSHMLFVDASAGRVAIGTSDTTSSGNLIVAGSAIIGRTSSTTGDFFSSGGGNSGAYNGIAIMSNSDAINAQSNTSLSSWIVDVGGRAGDGLTFPVSTADSFSVRRVAAGGTYYGAANYFQISGGSTVINEDSNDHDFRIESNSLSHAITVDAGNNKVGIGGSVQFGAGPVLQVAGVSGGPNTTGSLASGVLSVTAGNDGLAIGTRNVSPFGVWMQSGWQGSMSSNHYPITMNPLGANVAIGNEYNPPNKLTVKGDASVSTYLYSSNPKYTFNGSGYNGAYSVSTQLIKLGTWNTQQNGEDLHIKVFIGSGYNAAESQIAIYDLYWRTANGSSNISGSSGAFYANGWVTYTMMGGTYSPIDLFYVDQNSSTSYTVYMRSNTLIGNSNYYSVDTGNQGGWTHDAAIVDTASSPLTNYVTKDPSDNRILTTYNKTAFAAKMNATTNTVGTAYSSHTIATNRNSAFSTSTNRFTAPYDGRFVVGFSGWTNYAGNYLYSGIHKNGAAINATDFGNLHMNNGSTSLHAHGGVHVILDLLEGDYVQWVRTGGGNLIWTEFDAYAHDV